MINELMTSTRGNKAIHFLPPRIELIDLKNNHLPPSFKPAVQTGIENFLEDTAALLIGNDCEMAARAKSDA